MEEYDHQLYERFDRLVARHKTLIDRLCVRYALGDEGRSAELRQDCYIALWHYLPSLREGVSAFHEAAWVMWHCRSVFSHLRRQRSHYVILPINEELAESEADGHDGLLRDTIEVLANRLTPHERRAFFLMADGYTADELAHELGIKHRSAVTLRHRIVEKLRQCEREGTVRKRCV